MITSFKSSISVSFVHCVSTSVCVSVVSDDVSCVCPSCHSSSVCVCSVVSVLSSASSWVVSSVVCSSHSSHYTILHRTVV